MNKGGAMDIGFFELLTPVTYWLLIIMWSFILYFYIRRLRADWRQGSLMLLLFIILTIDAFRTLFESFYFGAWYTARVGLLPMDIHDFLVQPHMVIIPKLLNVFAAGLVITILFRFWLPREGEEISNLETTVRRRTLELSETVEKLKSEVRHSKRMDEALTAREREFRTLAENSPDNIARYDTTGRVLYCNPRLLETLGERREEEFLRKTPLECFPGGEFREYQKKIEQVLQSGEEASCDLVLPDIGKGERFHNIRFVAERDQNGALTGVMTIGRDITERKRAEEERNANLRFFKRMDRINQAIQGTADLEEMMGNVLDAVLAIFDCDRAYLLYPCDPQATSCSVSMERHKPEYPGAMSFGIALPVGQELAEKFHLLLNSNHPVKFGPQTANKPVPPQISERFGIRSMLATALYPREGKPWEFGIHQCSREQDWTAEEEKLFQEIGHRLGDALSTLLVDRDLRQSERRFITLVNQAADAFFVHDQEGCFLNVNRTACESLGYTREELLAMNVADVDAEFVSHVHVKNFWSKLTPDHPVTLEGMHKRKNGTTFPVEVRLCLSQLDDRRVILALARDITERKAAGEELKRLNEELERRVKERTAELEQNNEELEQMNQLFVGRELRMVELKERILALEEQCGRSADVAGGSGAPSGEG
jgi:PAS domain S-box-containing protein